MAYDEDEELPQLELRKFNWEAFKPDRVVMLVGKRGTGKSVLLRDLLSHLSREYDGGVAMSPTPESQDMFREFMPDSCVFNEYSSEKIGEIVTKLRQFNHMGVYKRVFVLLDDCMFDASVLKSKQMRDIHMNGRTSLPTPRPPPPSTRCGLVLFMEQVCFFVFFAAGGWCCCCCLVFPALPNRSTRPARVFAGTPSLRWTLGENGPRP
ncbi:pox A32 superfamily incomplete domain [Pandoravirus japonicus]|uniref:Pox A32 superfamily incomplete domain n=1 Tax=Pandoravirus japonicus TaxID=2823154 RepID=A0A811BQI6_9VIRU|nr:pox A32 superfamily incomplete domain [Pandoravirus japonicus]